MTLATSGRVLHIKTRSWTRVSRLKQVLVTKVWRNMALNWDWNFVRLYHPDMTEMMNDSTLGHSRVCHNSVVFVVYDQ